MSLADQITEVIKHYGCVGHSCMTAKGKVCTCPCKGKWHGVKLVRGHKKGK